MNWPPTTHLGHVAGRLGEPLAVGKALRAQHVLRNNGDGSEGGSGTARGVWLAQTPNTTQPSLAKTKHSLIEVEHLVRDLKELLTSFAAHDDGYLRDQQVQRERLTQLPW